MSGPAVVLHAGPCAAAALRELRAGLEEEGVPCEVVTVDAAAASAAGRPEPAGAEAAAEAAASGAAALAHAAARTSPVGVGLGLDADGACLHLPQLAPGAPLQRLSLNPPHDAERLRVLGHNAARLVKGAPLKELP